MLKNIFITILLICSVLVVWGQKSVKVKVSGNIITTDGVPAEFINIQLKNTFYGGTSDGKGYFEFMAPAGQYTMIVQSIAAHRREFPVTIEEGKENHFADIEIRENISSNRSWLRDSFLLNRCVILYTKYGQSIANRSVRKRRPVYSLC